MRNELVWNDDERPLTLRAVSEFEALPLEWFWKPFIPLAMVTTMFGDGGVGKSTICIDLISRLTRGKLMPLCKEGAISGSAIILTKEDDVNRLVRPRLDAAKAKIEHVHMPGYEVPDNPKEFELIDALDSKLDELERLIIEKGDVRLIVIDPANDFVGKFDPHDDKQVRQFLIPLSRLAARHNLALVVVSHINKSQLQAAHHRGLGSVAWRNVPRSAVLVADDPDVGGRKLMVQTKTNLTEFGRTALGLTMRTVKVGKAGYGAVNWEDEFSDADPEELLAKRKPKTKLERAKDLLQDWLKDGSMLREEIKFMAKGENISWETIKRAKKQLHVISFKRKGETKYRWRLPRRRT
jgi:RecA-family ATPase